MTSNYSSIRTENEPQYGMVQTSAIGRIGKMLLANLYADRTHFIFELLQNAEDAMARRGRWQGSREVRFTLSKVALQVLHFGEPFDERDVRAICNIALTTKDLTDIGHFGIGFKSVYAFTDLPEVHSGEEDFAIENYVWPASAEPVDRQHDETVFLLPLRPEDTTALDDITDGLRKLGPQTLLFLRQIDEIAWSVEGGPSGLYLRSKPETIGENVRRITVIGQEEGKPDIEETWLVFSRAAKTDGGAVAGQVEIAFSITQDKESHQRSVQAVSDSPLVAFFPTVLQTYLGFLVQGPYRTTPSRDNVPPNDQWNQYLVRETATLLVEALRSLRDLGLLDTGALRSLPLDRTKFAEGQMFAPLFETVRSALVSGPLLPRFDDGHVSASEAKLARTQDLRELFGPRQLCALFGVDGDLIWLSSDISQDRTPELRQYLMHELGIAEVTPETILPRLTKLFLEAQSDDWILKLYEFLNGQPALRGRLNDLPLIRLEDGMHVPARSDGHPKAFLPSMIETAFPTVRRTVCETDEAREFLQSLGLTESDPVDDVVWNVLPRYRTEDADVADADYEADIRRILTAFGTDSKTRRGKLLAALRNSYFVKAVNSGNGAKKWAKPGAVYLATERLKGLFAGVTDVLFVDDSYACLKGEDIRDLLDLCGATRYLQPIRVEPNFTWEQRREMRRVAGCESSSREETIDDYSLRGLDALLAALPGLSAAMAARKAALLWEALGDVQDRRRTRAFSGTYRWFYVNLQSCDFDAAFIRRLNETAWILDANGHLQRPEFVVFDTLGWKLDPFLLSKIRFKPPIIEALAREAGIEPGVLDLLKRCGITSEEELKARLGIEKEAPEGAEEDTEDLTPEEAREKTLGRKPKLTAPAKADPDEARTSAGRAVGTTSAGPDGAAGHAPGSRGAGDSGARARDSGSGGRRPGSAGGRPFISYVAAHPDDEEPDSDGLDQQARMALEEKAIQFILQREPQLHRTPTHNPGYDLFETGKDEQTIRWVEVKAMTRSLNDRPVGLSRTQFECAREHGKAYWLYVVEQASSPEDARTVRIQDPAGMARTFTFDHGWLSVADINDDNNDLR